MNLRLSKAAGYAIHALHYMCRANSPKPIMVREIAQHLQLPYDSVLKVLRQLAKARVVTAHRGSKGGFSLRRPGAEITFLDVIEVIDGPLEAEPHPAGKGSHGKPIANDILAEATAQLKRLLAKGTIDSI
ncbi:MAG: Rrf2 family transcriptional regulator [Candidatus Zixiibacteriota bacterium]